MYALQAIRNPSCIVTLHAGIPREKRDCGWNAAEGKEKVIVINQDWKSSTLIDAKSRSHIATFKSIPRNGEIASYKSGQFGHGVLPSCGFSNILHVSRTWATMKLQTLLASALWGYSVSAQTVGAYGQCGGENYSGSSVCVPGYVCTFYNDWYSQCVPGASWSCQDVECSPKNDIGTAITTTTTSTTTTSSQATSTSTTTTTSTTTSSTPASTGFAKVNGLNFTIDGETNYFVGTNTYWLAFLNNNSDVDLVLKDIASSGMKILRVWGFNDVNTVPSPGTIYFQLLANGTATVNTGADGLEKLDYVVSSAEAHDIKLIIPFVNNWNDYGGMNAYVTAFGGSATTWYTNTEIQAAYQAYIKAVVSRYSKSPAIFAWELGNEPRCHGCNTSVITNWATTTSAYIKSLDPNHMVTTGIGKLTPQIPW